MLCCETLSATLVVIIIWKNTATFTIYSFCILCLEHHYCGDQQWLLKVKFVKCLFLLKVVLVSWSCYFGLGLVSSGLGLGLVLLVLILFLVLRI